MKRIIILQGHNQVQQNEWRADDVSISQISNMLAQTLMCSERPNKSVFNQSQLITMHYEKYLPLNYAVDINQRAINKSFYASKLKTSEERNRASVNQQYRSLIEKDEKSLSQPKIIDLEFQKFARSKRKRLSQKQMLSTHEYCSIMIQSMQKYYKRVENDKRKKLQKCQKIKNFGVNIQSIRVKEQNQKLLAVLERRRSLNQRKKLIQKQRQISFNEGKINNESDIQIQINNESIITVSQQKQLSKTISTAAHHHTRKSNIISKRKLMIKGEKKDNDKKLISKLNRMFISFNIILSSYGVALDKSDSKTDPLNDNKNKKNDKKYTYFVGKGNNKNLIISIFKKRWWWTEAQDIMSANFVWTQLKIQSVLQKQKQLTVAEMQAIEPHLYSNQNQSIKYTLQQEPSRQIYNIFHENHNKKFHQKLHLRDEQKYLRKMKVPQIIHNHYISNYMLGNKKALLYNMTQYKQFKKENTFEYIPLTFHVQKVNSKAWRQFEKKAKQFKKTLWIVKPGENSNRGQGIFLTDSIQNIKNRLQSNKKHTFVIQKYIKNNLTFQKRKFDIRTYLLMVTVGGVKKFYWYSEGYLRTASQIYDLSDLDDPFIHLTNDAIQATGQKYGKFEKGNKITYNEFQRYLDLNYMNENYKVANLVEKMKNIAKQVVEATYFKLDPSQKQCGFQLFGMDFLIDSSFKPWLLQVNTNPCLQLSSPTLQRLIPRMLQNLFRIVVDPIYQPVQNQIPRNLSCYIPDNIIEGNRFQLIFDTLFDRNFEWEEYSGKQNTNRVYEDQNEEFDNDGEIIKIE